MPTAVPTAIVKLTVIERNALLDAAAMVYRAVWTPEVSNGHVQLVEVVSYLFRDACIITI
jgi:hypothetical protein